MPFPKFLRSTTTVALSSAATGPLGGAASGSKKLNLSVARQQQTNWCWAAVSTSVSHFYTTTSAWTQCTVADAALSRTDCCGAGASDLQKCNKPWYLDRALSVTDNLARVEARPFTFAEVQNEIGQGAPLGTRVGWNGGGGHFQTVVGWVVAADGSEYIDVSDPIYLDTNVAFPQFVSAYQGNGVWTHSYVTQNPPATTAAMSGGNASEVFDPDALGA